MALHIVIALTTLEYQKLFLLISVVIFSSVLSLIHLVFSIALTIVSTFPTIAMTTSKSKDIKSEKE